MNARTWRWGVAVLLLVSLAGTAWAQGVAPKGILPTPPESTELQVAVWVDRGAYAVGESITIHFSVNKAAYVYIWDITPDGQANQIFPNSQPGGADNYVQAGEHIVPGNWQVAPPLGTEYLQILATTSAVDPFAFFTGDPEAFQDLLEVQILGILPVTERSWNFTSFEIVQGAAPTYGKLDVNSAPSGASVYVDGSYAGYTPASIYVPQGYRQISLVKTGYQTWQGAVFVIAGRTRIVNVTLTATTPPNQLPVASFTYSPTNPAVGEWVQFSAAASYDPDGSIASTAWNFGDGTTGSGSPAWHRFMAAGNYSVTLTVTDNRGATATTSQVVRVGPTNASPVASFTHDPASAAPGAWFQFDGSASADPDGTIASYAWNFGDGTTGTGAVAWHRFLVAGTYVVTLTVTDNLGAQSTTSRSVIIASANQPPTAVFSVLPPAPTVGAWVRFDASGSTDADGSIASYQWTFGDGTPGSTGSVVYHQFLAGGSYVVTLTVTDDDGASTSATQTVPVGSPLQAPVADFTYSPTAPLVGQTITLNASASYDPDGSIVSYQWDLNGDGTNDATGALAVVAYSTAGTVAIRLTVTDNAGLSTSVTKSVVIALSGGGATGAPPMGTTPGIYVWGSDVWHVTVNAGAGWTAPRGYRIELRTDGAFATVAETWTGGVAPLGIIPTPSTSGKTLLLEGSIQTGSVDYTFTIPGSTSMWLSLKLDQNGDGTLDQSTSFVYLRGLMVHPPANPFVVGLPSGSTGSLIPSLNFRIGTAWSYTETTRFVFWSTTIGALESGL
ncbi:MAG: PKD domain-containing protein [Candidatus Bipolaricaulota bacterium]